MNYAFSPLLLLLLRLHTFHFALILHSQCLLEFHQESRFNRCTRSKMIPLCSETISCILPTYSWIKWSIISFKVHHCAFDDSFSWRIAPSFTSCIAPHRWELNDRSALTGAMEPAMHTHTHTTLDTDIRIYGTNVELLKWTLKKTYKTRQ